MTWKNIPWRVKFLGRGSKHIFSFLKENFPFFRTEYFKLFFEKEKINLFFLLQKKSVNICFF